MPYKTSFHVTGAIVLGVVSGFIYRHYQNTRPLFTTGEGVEDLTKTGHLGDAIEKGKRLFAAYNNANGDLRAIPHDLQTLPDQVNAETDVDRSLQGSAWEFPINNRVYRDVAFTPIYMLVKIAATTRAINPNLIPQAFLIFYKDGRIEQVPVSKLRLLNTPQGRVTVWPGIEGYERGEHHPKYGG